MLAALLVYGMPSLARQLDTGDQARVRVTVVGEQWWWRVRYEGPGATTIELANELRLPRGQVTAVALASPDVIHSFWMPSLAGKIDMMPGRITRLTLEPATRRHLSRRVRGILRRLARADGVCRRGDGAGRLRAVARRRKRCRPPDRRATSRRARAPFSQRLRRVSHIRGSPAAVAPIGPDLTHVGSRGSIAAASLPNQPDDLARWIAKPDHDQARRADAAVRHAAAGELRAIAAYLGSLQ